MKRKKILFIYLEFPRWQDASKWSFNASVGLISAFAANDVDCFALPAFFRYGPGYHSWVDYAREILGDTKFDQVWFEAVHSPISDDVFEYLVSLAPVRLGFVFESLVLLPQEWAKNPEGCRRREETMKQRIPAMTHMLNSDETDAARLNGSNGLIARSVLPGFVVPREMICYDPPPPPVNAGIFFGTLYGDRKKWIDHPLLQPILKYSGISPEMNTPYPAAFDDLHLQMQGIFEGGVIETDTLKDYIEGNLLIRTECFKLWLEGLRLGAAVVNLPQWGRMYASRIIEGMAAGRPVIAHRMEDLENYPVAKNAFEDGKEILLYSSEVELAEHLNRVIADAQFCKMITDNARRKVEQTHTNEVYVKELLNWIEQG